MANCRIQSGSSPLLISFQLAALVLAGNANPSQIHYQSADTGVSDTQVILIQMAFPFQCNTSDNS